MSLVKNPVLLLVVGLPLAAVIGSFASLAVTLAHQDSELPEQYHWEGFQLDRDFSRSQHAAELGVQATLRNVATSGRCEIDLAIAGEPPEQLRLTLAHATRGDIDQRIVFQRVTGAETYFGQCHAIPEGHWRIELTDAAQTWSVRDSTRTISQPVRIDAITADDD
ncbi:MAG TPA: FixH family protein [Steroidobacteraceae bacterium]|nr:FixH family protein [Steroidobacteraceae bacterium]